MVSIYTLFLAASSIAGVFAAPTELAIRSPGELAERQTITTSQTGTSNGYYYSFCKCAFLANFLTDSDTPLL